MKTIEFRIEVEPIKPDTPSEVRSLLKKAIDESISASEIDKILPEKPVVIFEQNLPTGIEIAGLVVGIAQLVIAADPLFLTRIKLFLTMLFGNDNFKQVASERIRTKITIGGKKIEVETSGMEDTIQIITKECEVILKTKKQD